MFTASFDMGLSQTLSGRGYEALTRFTHWLAEIQRPGGAEPIAAWCVIPIHGDYNPAVRNIAQPESCRNAEERQPTVSWM